MKKISWTIVIFYLCLFFTSANYAELPVSIDNLPNAIIESEVSNKPVLVIFGADWCKYCKLLKSDLPSFYKELDNFIICQVDYDENTDLVKEYNVTILPDYFVLDHKIETKRKKGYNRKEFLEWLKNGNKK
jgi:thioredoxin 1